MDAQQMNRASIARFREALRVTLALRKNTGMRAALAYLDEATRVSLGRRQAAVHFGRYLWGRSPALPGSPPKSLTGKLQRSITTQLARRGRAVVGKIGATERYARILELGGEVPSRRPRRASAMVMALGGKVRFARYAKAFHLRPRPWLRPVLEKHAKAVSDILQAHLSGRAR